MGDGLSKLSGGKFEGILGKLTSNKEIFQREVRAEEVSRVLNNYYATGTLDSCLALIKLLKSDLLVLEHISGRRGLTE